MKKLGLIGGMSWESTSEYYRIINQAVNQKLGGVHSCDCIITSFDFDVIEKLQHEGNWKKLSHHLADEAIRLEKAGAEILLLCTNTMHLLAGELQEKVTIPLLHIADTAGKEIVKKKIGKVGLLGTKFTMEKDFYKERLRESFHIEVIIPSKEEREFIHRVIYTELVKGKILEESRQKFLSVIDGLIASGAGGIVLGCTEIPLLIKQKDCPVHLFDTTTIHATAAVDLALEG